jgi:threonylcarbamoyladenosine tRNA methylthiotransferase MtaB
MDYQGKRAAFCTLGCKLNFSETSTMARSLENAGFQKVDFEEPADLYVINTCSVTQAGDKSSRNMIRRAIRTNPEAFIVVVGCYSQLKAGEIEHIEGVDLILGTQEKFRIPSLLGNLQKRTRPEISVTRLPEIRKFNPAASSGERTRSFLKIQDGCDYFCTFCTVPFARGHSRSDNLENTVAEAQKVVKQGFKEVVLTGVNIGDFGKSSGETFRDLLTALERVEGLQRLRIGSIEPNLLNDDIIRQVAESTVIMPHFHIPLQAGTDEILGLMKRKYDTALFSSRISAIRERLPLAFIGVDVIAGSPGETLPLFEASYEFINNLEISQLHAFPYSERSGTNAIRIPGKVSTEEKKVRTQRYINLSEKKLRYFYEKNVGTVQSVLFEERKINERMEGFTCNYIRVETAFQEEFLNEPVNVELVSILPNGNMLGKIDNFVPLGEGGIKGGL